MMRNKVKVKKKKGRKKKVYESGDFYVNPKSSQLIDILDKKIPFLHFGEKRYRDKKDHTSGMVVDMKWEKDQWGGIQITILDVVTNAFGIQRVVDKDRTERKRKKAKKKNPRLSEAEKKSIVKYVPDVYMIEIQLQKRDDDGELVDLPIYTALKKLKVRLFKEAMKNNKEYAEGKIDPIKWWFYNTDNQDPLDEKDISNRFNSFVHHGHKRDENKNIIEYNAYPDTMKIKVHNDYTVKPGFWKIVDEMANIKEKVLVEDYLDEKYIEFKYLTFKFGGLYFMLGAKNWGVPIGFVSGYINPKKKHDMINDLPDSIQKFTVMKEPAKNGKKKKKKANVKELQQGYYDNPITTDEKKDVFIRGEVDPKTLLKQQNRRLQNTNIQDTDDSGSDDSDSDSDSDDDDNMNIEDSRDEEPPTPHPQPTPQASFVEDEDEDEKMLDDDSDDDDDEDEEEEEKEMVPPSQPIQYISEDEVMVEKESKPKIVGNKRGREVDTLGDERNKKRRRKKEKKKKKKKKKRRKD